MITDDDGKGKKEKSKDKDKGKDKGKDKKEEKGGEAKEKKKGKGPPGPPPPDDSGCFGFCRSGGGDDPVHPQKVDPKTFFANERTFMKWMQAAIWLTSLALGLHVVDNPVANTASLVVFPVAFLMLIYSLYMFLRRESALANRRPDNYSDKVGPVALVLALLITLIIVFTMRFFTPKTVVLTRSDYELSPNCIPGPDKFFLPFQRPKGVFVNDSNSIFITYGDTIIEIPYARTAKSQINYPFLATPLYPGRTYHFESIAGVRGIPALSGVYFLANEDPAYPSIVVVNFNKLDIVGRPTIIHEVSVKNVFGAYASSPNFHFEGITFYQQTNESRLQFVITANTSQLARVEFALSLDGVNNTFGIEATLVDVTTMDSIVSQGSADQNKMADCFYDKTSNTIYVLYDNAHLVAEYEWGTGKYKKHSPLPITNKHFAGLSLANDLMVMVVDTPAQLWYLQFSPKTGFPDCLPATS